MSFSPLPLLCMSEITPVKRYLVQTKKSRWPLKENSVISHIFTSRKFYLFRGWWSPLWLFWCTNVTFVGKSMVICMPAKWLVVICVLNESIQNGTLQREWCVECIELYQDHHCWDGFFVSSCVCDHSSNSLEWLGEASKIHLVLFTQVEIILQHTGDGLESSQFWPFW